MRGRPNSGSASHPGSIILETDCARVAKALQEKEDRSELGFIVAEAKEKLSCL
jgi:hypothetical protein